MVSCGSQSGYCSLLWCIMHGCKLQTSPKNVSLTHTHTHTHTHTIYMNMNLHCHITDPSLCLYKTKNTHHLKTKNTPRTYSWHTVIVSHRIYTFYVSYAGMGGLFPALGGPCVCIYVCMHACVCMYVCMWALTDWQSSACATGTACATISWILMCMLAPLSRVLACCLVSLRSTCLFVCV